MRSWDDIKGLYSKSWSDDRQTDKHADFQFVDPTGWRGWVKIGPTPKFPNFSVDAYNLLNKYLYSEHHSGTWTVGIFTAELSIDNNTTFWSFYEWLVIIRICVQIRIYLTVYQIQFNKTLQWRSLMWNSHPVTSSVFSADFHRCLIIKLWCVSIRVSNGRHKPGLPVNIVGDLAIEHMEIHLMGNITFFMVCSRKIRKWKRSEDDRHEATVSQPHAVFSFNSTWVARINSF